MITKILAIEIAKSIGMSAKHEIAAARANGNMSAVYAIRATAFRSVGDIWYDILPNKTRAEFGYDKNNLTNFMYVALDSDII